MHKHILKIVLLISCVVIFVSLVHTSTQKSSDIKSEMLHGADCLVTLRNFTHIPVCEVTIQDSLGTKVLESVSKNNPVRFCEGASFGTKQGSVEVKAYSCTGELLETALYYIPMGQKRTFIIK